MVYTGAILMLLLFSLMPVGRDASASLIETLRGKRIDALVLGIVIPGLVGAGTYRAIQDGPPAAGFSQASVNGNVQGVARDIFTKYVFASEVTSALLTTAAIGAMILAHVERGKGERPGQPA